MYECPRTIAVWKAHTYSLGSRDKDSHTIPLSLRKQWQPEMLLSSEQPTIHVTGLNSMDEPNSYINMTPSGELDVVCYMTPSASHSLEPITSATTTLQT